jgi:hypothetical protein
MAFATIDVTKGITGTIPVANGGTGVASGTTGQFLKFTGTTTLASAGAGITHASMWRMTSDLTGPVDPISANLEKVDTDGYSSLGSDMTVSSGIWTFPTTGIWWIRGHGNLYFNGDSRHQHFAIHTTTNDSSYSLASSAYSSISKVESNATQQSSEADFIFDVTDTAQCKCKFAFENVTNSSVVLAGDSNHNFTWFQFTRLGDT